MLTALYDAARRIGDGLATDDGPAAPCNRGFRETVDAVIDATSGRLRAVPGHSRLLRGPIVTALRHVIAVTTQLPGAIPCGRAAFSADPRVNAFFVDPASLQQLFSDDAGVRRFFAANPGAGSCIAPLCMHQAERRRLGMGLVEDRLHKDVMQTTVSFRDHRLLAATAGEEQARAALQCWLFNALVDHARDAAGGARGRRMVIEERVRALRARLRRLTRRPDADGDADRAGLTQQIDDLEDRLGRSAPAPATPRQQLDHVADTLTRAADLVTLRRYSLYLDRFGIKHADGASDPAFEVALQELRIGTGRPCVVSLMRFPRAELLPARDFLSEAGRFLLGGGRLQ